MVSRCVPSGTPLGRKTTSWVSVALITVIWNVSHQTCGACAPKPDPCTVSVWFVRSTEVLRIISCFFGFWAYASWVPNITIKRAVISIRLERRIKASTDNG
jgi:hypothetical protein